jgi:hypothetical protein
MIHGDGSKNDIDHIRLWIMYNENGINDNNNDDD